MMETHQRLQSKSIVKNPFFGSIKKGKGVFVDYYIVDIEPVYPRVYLFGWFPLIIAFFFARFFMIFVAIFFFSTIVLWSKFFMFTFLKKGLRKHGFLGTTKLVLSPKIEKRIIDGAL